MGTHLLFESPSGYAILQVIGLDEIGQNPEAVRNSVTDLNRFGKVVKLLAFQPFETCLEALTQINAVSEGILTDELRNFLELNIQVSKSKDFVLGVSDSKLGASISDATKIPCICNVFILELLRGVRMHFDKFIKDLKVDE